MKNKDSFVISNVETFNKYLLTISSAAFPAIFYLIDQNKGYKTGLKISLGMFSLAIMYPVI